MVSGLLSDSEAQVSKPPEWLLGALCGIGSGCDENTLSVLKAHGALPSTLKLVARLVEVWMYTRPAFCIANHIVDGGPRQSVGKCAGTRGVWTPDVGFDRHNRAGAVGARDRARGFEFHVHVVSTLPVPQTSPRPRS